MDSGHHPDVAEVVDGVVPHRCSEDREVFGPQLRAADHALVLVDVVDDGRRRLGPIAQALQGPGHRPVDDRHGAATDQPLGLDEAQVGFDSRGVAVHEEADGPRRGQDGGLTVPYPDPPGKFAGLRPCTTTSVDQVGGVAVVERLGGRPVPLQDCQGRSSVGSKTVEGAQMFGHTGRSEVGVAGHQRGDC